MPGKTTGRVFRFGTFEADETAGELRRQGVRIKLHSQPFQVLILLLERPSELVTREELRQRLWGQDTFVDFDHGLNTTINKLRQALGDSASAPRHIETIAGKGYRFLSPVTLVVDTAHATSAQQVPKPSIENSRAGLLTTPDEVPRAPRTLVRSLLLLIQAMYLAFYVSALDNLQEIYDIFSDAWHFPPGFLLTLLVASAVILIPVRLFLLAAVAFDYEQLSSKFARLFPLLLPLDLLWALSPLLLIHHVSIGLALGMSAALVYLPFAQRSLILMYSRK
jgi:DNA-binding winged helix-turn-helix (wHTH) protein